MKKFIAVCLLGLLFGADLFAQRPEIMDEVRVARIDSLIDDLFFGDELQAFVPEVSKNYQFLYFRTNYDSRTYFAGREIGDEQYNLSGQLFYMHSNGIFAGISGSWYSQLDPGYRTTVLTLGFGKGLKKASFLRYRFSYDYFLFHQDDPDFDPLYTSSLNTGMTLKSKSLGTRLDASFLLGKEVSAQLSWDAYAYLNLVKLGKYDKIRLEPEVSLYFATETAAFSLSEVLIDPVTNEVTGAYYEDTFGLLNIQLSLPLNITFHNFDLELSYQYNLPRTQGNVIDYPESSSFRLSLGYMFSL